MRRGYPGAGVGSGGGGAPGEQGPPGPAPSGSGIVKVTAGVLENPAGGPLNLSDATEITGTISDAQHGNRAGGAAHAEAVASGAAGFISGANQAKLDGVQTGAAAPGGNDGEVQRRNGTSQAGIPGWIGTANGIEIGGGLMPAIGDFRYASGARTIIAQKHIGGVNDLTAMCTTPANALCIGGPSTFATANCYGAVQICTQSAAHPFQLIQGAATSLYITASLFQCTFPRVGFVSPYASEGRAVQAMSDAGDTTAGSAAYSRNVIRCAGALTANRNLILPTPASEDASYRKIIRNETTGGFAVVVKTSAGTATATIPAGQQAEVLVSPTTMGVSLVSAAVAY